MNMCNKNHTQGPLISPESPKPPEGMVEVSKDEFYSTVGKLDVHPHSQEFYTPWKLRDGTLVGWGSKGYASKFYVIEKYYVIPSIIKKARA